jgi:natural product precursor
MAENQQPAEQKPNSELKLEDLTQELSETDMKDVQGGAAKNTSRRPPR